MKYTLKKVIEKPFLYSENNITVKVNKEFINLTGYSNKELIGKSLSEISNMLKIDSQIYLENIESEYSCYMFTKEYEPKEIVIFCKSLKYENKKIYFIKEDLNSGIKEKFDFLKQLYKESKTGFAISSVPDLILLKLNENFMNFLNEPYNKMKNSIGKKQKEIMDGYESSKAEEIWNTVISTGKKYCIKEFQHNASEKEVTYWNVSIVPIFIEGKLKYIIHMILDVTERVLNRKTILSFRDITQQVNKNKIMRMQNKQLETIMENISDAVVIFNKDGNITRANKATKSYDFNYHTEVKKMSDCFKKNESCELKENSAQPTAQKCEKVIRYQININNDNSIKYTELNCTPIYDREGNFIKGILLIRDITDMVQFKQNLLMKTQYNLLNKMIENLELGFVRCSYPEFKITDFNNKAYSNLKQINPLIGSSSSIKGQNYFDIFKVDGKGDKIKVIQNLIEKKEGAYFNIRKTSEEKFLKYMCQPLFGLNNQIIEIIVIGIDITEEVRAKNKMEEILKMQEELFGNISHELKTPLNVIFSANQLMEVYLKNDSIEVNKEKISHKINIIKQNCYRFTKLINNIVDISKIKSGFLELNLSNENIVNITEDIVQSVAEYINGKGLNITFDTNTEEKIIACDPEKIERIILNLISNAIKFSNPDGRIFVNLIDKGGTVEIAVKDTGIGIDKKYLDVIFERFHQVDKSLSRNAEGSGIGLSLVKSMVELHGGKISVDSEVGGGSIFKIELPARTVENPKAIQQANTIDNKVEMINIEFSDIYSI